jgi:hypothetical protein
MREQKLEPTTHKCDSEHLEWNESYYLAFYNKEYNLGGVSRLGFKPNKQEGMTFFFLFLPNGSAAIYHHIDEISDYLKLPPVGGISHICNPDGKWIYKFKGKMVFIKEPEDLPKIRNQN